MVEKLKAKNFEFWAKEFGKSKSKIATIWADVNGMDGLHHNVAFYSPYNFVFDPDVFKEILIAGGGGGV